MRKYLTTILTIVTISVTSICVYAENITDLQEKSNQINQSITETNNRLQAVQEQMSENMQQLQELDTQLAQSEEELNKINIEVSTLTTQISENEQKLSNAQEKYDKIKKVLDARVIEIYKSDNLQLLGVLFASKNVKEFFQTYDKLILRERPTHTTGIPKNLDILLGSKNIKDNTDLSFFKTAAVGADTMNINTEMKVNTFLEKHGSCAKVIKGYGATEGNGTIATTSNKINKIGSVGIPFIGNNIGIFDMDNNQELTYGQKGEICYCGDSVMKKYYNNDAETKKVLKMHDDGKVWMHSGDIGYIDNDGFLYVVGRIKRMFVRSGFKLFSSEIENAIGSHYAVKNVAAVGVDDSIEGSVPVVSIVLKDE